MPLDTITVILFAILGALNSGYLIYAQAKELPIRYFLFSEESNIKVAQSEYSKTMGIDDEYLGVFYFALLFLIALGNLLGLVSFWPIILITSIGLIFTAYFIAIQAFILKAYHTYCVFSAIIMLVISIIVLFLHR